MTNPLDIQIDRSLWPKCVKIFSHTLPIQDKITAIQRAANVEWFECARIFKLLEKPEQPKLAFFMPHKTKAYMKWQDECSEIDRMNASMLDECKKAIREQVSFIAKCPVEAVMVWFDEYYFGSWIRLRASGPGILIGDE